MITLAYAGVKLSRLIQLVWAAFQMVGLDCKSVGSLNKLHGGTRSRLHPDGVFPLIAREVAGNRDAKLAADLCLLLVKSGAHFSIENPKGSLVFHSAPFATLKGRTTVFEVSFEQCAFGLCFPDSAWNDFCRKATTFWSSIPDIANLERHCPRISATHKHVHAFGTWRKRPR